MKKLSLCLVALTVATACFALTKEEREARMQKVLAEEGGLVVVAPTGNVLRIVNAQKSLPASVFTPIMNDIRKIGMDVPMEVSDATPLTGKDPLALARSAMLTKKTGAVIAVVDVLDFPTLIAAPENGYAIVNLRNLKADKPSDELLNERLTKEVWRGIGFALGGATSMMGSCVMQPVSSLDRLDRIAARRFGPDAAIRVIRSLPAYGINRYERMSYADACEMGVAPSPTNDLQKAIWEKVHALPTNPIKIAPETKKVSE